MHISDQVMYKYKYTYIGIATYTDTYLSATYLPTIIPNQGSVTSATMCAVRVGAPTGPIPQGDEIREIRPPTKKNSLLGLGSIEAQTNGNRPHSGGRPNILFHI